MATQLEGPIVDSFYDMSLISWHKKLEPPLPTHDSPAADFSGGSFEQPSFKDLFHLDGTIKNSTVRNANSSGYDIFKEVEGRESGIMGGATGTTRSANI